MLGYRAAQKIKKHSRGYTRQERRRGSKRRVKSNDSTRVYGANIPILSGAVSWLAVTVLAVLVSLSSYQGTRSILASEPRYLLEIASFLRNRSTPGEPIIVRKPHLAYLAGLKWVFPHLNTAEDYLAKAREIGARHIVYSDFETIFWPALKSLRDPKALPDAFKLIYRHEPTRTLVYEIQP
jgi:hypothetical protein